MSGLTFTKKQNINQNVNGIRKTKKTVYPPNTMNMQPTNNLKRKRFQFPIKLRSSTTNSEAQDQSLRKLGSDLRNG